MIASLFCSAVALATLSGVPALLLSRGTDLGQRIAAILQLLAAALGITVAIAVFVDGPQQFLRVHPGGDLSGLKFGLDALSALFLLPVCVVCGCAAVYDLGYHPQSRHPESGRQLRVFSGILFASMIALLAAQDVLAFLFAWESMALAAFFLIVVEHQRSEVRTAGWIYLAATHAGTLALIAMFGCWSLAGGGSDLVPLAADGARLTRGAVFVLGLVGFGLKAGIVPLHFWLPAAHASAPSHVSAVLSGVLIKMGVYGVARVCWLLPAPPVWWGVTLLAIGVLSSFAGVAFAITQHDIKRLLAYHSIENIGIIFLGLGVAMVGRTSERADLIALGVAGGLLHVWNHALFKALLFLGAGAVIHRTGMREIDRLGGLARRMPHTAICFLIGAIAICGLPPLNGFVSELLTYLGLFSSMGGGGVADAFAMVAVPVLAAVGAMALLCFVKVYGVAFLGAPRSPAAAQASPVGLSLRIPMYLLAGMCAWIGLAPVTVIPVLRAVVVDWTPAGRDVASLAALAPLTMIGALGGVLVVSGLACMIWLRRRRRVQGPPIGTWDCGYVRPTPRMQYTGSSFAQQFGDLGRLLLLPRTRKPEIRQVFPGPDHFHSEVVDPVLDRMLVPVTSAIAAACNWLRLLQRGRVQIYLLYVFVTLLVLLLIG